MWLRYTIDYLQQSTIHGLRYLSEGKCLEKFGWLIVIIVSSSFAGYMIYQTVEENNREPVLTTVETTSVQNVPFPAITIRADSRLVHLKSKALVSTLIQLLPNVYFSAEQIHGDLLKRLSI